MTVVVDLHGKPVDLSFTREAMAMPPADLAATIRRLTDDAAAAALTEGMAVLTAVIPPALLPPS